ncbi:serine protease, partial [Nocardiopsis sp. CNR-923]|uniref:S1 family peptidase n=1 Tax=Nocardiopsis sp. CNR-923 TaxID=1904965 RepID=UPI000A65795D
MPTAAHIARVESPTGAGSGCVIAPRLVLTCAHVVPHVDGEVSLSTPAGTATDEQTYTGRVVWRGTPHGRDDAALVEVTDPTWTAPPVRTRWGRLVTDRPGISCHTWGYPDLVQRQGRPVETSQPSGTINPGNRMIGDRYVLDITTHPPRWEQDGSRGAGCPGPRWCARVWWWGWWPRPRPPSPRQPGGCSRLRAPPRPGFRAVLADHDVSVVLEPVELAHLAHTPRTHHRPSPASLLEAHRKVVDFHGRDDTMDTLIRWCESNEALSAVVVHGPGGQGKTRLGHELTAHLAHPDTPGRRWATVWVKDTTTAEELAPVTDTTVPLLLVVDYAETRTTQLRRLLELCDRPPGSAPIRLLLLVRTVGEWWEQVNTTTGHLLADITRQIPLPPLAPRTVDRAREYRTALGHLAAALPTARTPTPADWDQVAADLPDPDLSGPGWDTVLSVHMRALADLLDTTQPPTTTPDSAVEGRVLAHEYRYWTHTATAHQLDEAELQHPLRDVLALAFTLTPAGIEEADHLLDNVTVLKGQTTARKHQIRRWINSLYPTGEAGVWGRLQPDRLLEYFLGTRLHTNPALFDPHLNTITVADAERLVTLYTRAAAHPALPGLGTHLTALCARHIRALGPAAVDVATQAENPGPLLRALEQTTADTATPIEVLAQLSAALPHFSHRLAEWAGQVSDRMVKARREQAAKDPDAFLPDLALSLNSQAIRLAGLGRREEALEAITEAVELCRTLAQQRPDAYLP